MPADDRPTRLNRRRYGWVSKTVSSEGSEIAVTTVLTPPTPRRVPPGPKGSFFGGNLPDFRRDRLGFLTRYARDYGDFVSLRFGPHKAILISDPEAIEYVLVTNAKNFTKHFALRLN